MTFNEKLVIGRGMGRWRQCPAVKQLWGGYSAQTLSTLAVSFMDDRAIDCLLSHGRSVLEEPAAERLSGRQCDSPGIYIHVIQLDEGSIGCYVGKSDTNIKRSLYDIRPIRTAMTRRHCTV